MKYIIDETTLFTMADAVRTAENSTRTYTPVEMTAAVVDMSRGLTSLEATLASASALVDEINGGVV